MDTLEIVGLGKSYEGKQNPFSKAQPKRALDNVSFTLNTGLYGLLGPNGAGKSTLINIITGSLGQTTGEVLWNGRQTSSMGIGFRRILGYMPQQQGLYNSFTGRRFLNYIAVLKEIPKTQIESEVNRVAAQVNLTQQMDKKLGAYSGGMKQRLLAASALIGSPKLLIMDEPTAGLDPKERVRLRELMNHQAEDKVVLIATHVVSDVESVAKEILLLKGGHIAGIGSPAHLVETHAPGGDLEDVYLSIFGNSV